MEGRAAPEDLTSLVLKALREAAMGRASKLKDLLERRPVEAFEALLLGHLALHKLESVTQSQILMMRCVWRVLGSLSPCVVSSRLHLLWEVLLQMESFPVAPSLVSSTLASLLGQETPVPGEAARRGKEWRRRRAGAVAVERRAGGARGRVADA
jgi:hypothetical protein